MTDPRLSVPLADLPGFDADGLTVKARGRDAMVLYDEVHDIDETTPAAVHVYNMPDLTKGDGHALYVQRSDVVLDFADSSTRDRAARWLGARKGLDAYPTAPGWRVQIHPIEPRAFGWLLTTFNRSLFYAHWASNSRQAGHPSIIPALCDLDPYDKERLPDMSRVVGAVALALVCQHVGGAS